MCFFLLAAKLITLTAKSCSEIRTLASGCFLFPFFFSLDAELTTLNFVVDYMLS